MIKEKFQIRHGLFLEHDESNKRVAKGIGEIFGAIRRLKNHSYEKAAKLSGCAYGMVRRIEAGENTMLTGLFMLADAYGITFSVRDKTKEKHAGNPPDSTGEVTVLNKDGVPGWEIAGKKINSESGLSPLRGQDVPERKLLIKKELGRMEAGAPNFHLFELLNVLRTCNIVLEMHYSEFESAKVLSKTAAVKPSISEELVLGGIPSKEQRFRFAPEKEPGPGILQVIGRMMAKFRERKAKSLSKMSKSTGHSFGSLRRIELGSNMDLQVFLDTANIYGVYFELTYQRKSARGTGRMKVETVVIDGKQAGVWEVLGEVIREAREAQDLNQTTAAGKYRLDRNELSRIENGKKTIRTYTFLRLLRVFRVELVMVFPYEEKSKPFDRIGLTVPTFEQATGNIREPLLMGKDAARYLPVKVGLIFSKVRTSRNASLRTVELAAGIDNSKLGKIEKGEIDIQVGTFLGIAMAMGVRVELVYEELPQKKQRDRFGSKPSASPIEKRVDVTRSRRPYLIVIGEAMKARRKAAGASLRDYAAVLGMDNSKIRKYEGGRSDVRLTTLGHILKTLKISLEVEYTLGG
jgi:transcriptional regulator with XRE-family HTH domain